VADARSSTIRLGILDGFHFPRFEQFQSQRMFLFLSRLVCTSLNQGKKAPNCLPEPTAIVRDSFL